VQPIVDKRARQGGFTIVESLITIAILGILLAVGVPNMSRWLGATAATGAAQFYAEGFTLARSQALANNSRSRLVFSDNDQSGQLDWRVDVCFPSADDACAAASTRWSTVEKAATKPDGGEVATKSVSRSSATLPGTTVLSVAPNDDSGEVYFTPLGWLDGASANVTRIDLTPAEGNADAFDDLAVVVTLAGAVVTCRPDVGAGDSRRCP